MKTDNLQKLFESICTSFGLTTDEYFSYTGQKRTPDKIAFVTQAFVLVATNSTCMNYTDVAKFLNKTPQAISTSYKKCMSYIYTDHPIAKLFKETVASSCIECEQVINKLTKSTYNYHDKDI